MTPLEYAQKLAQDLFEKHHFRDAVPNWECGDDLMIVLSQIDNMTSGLVRGDRPPAQIAPMSWRCPNCGAGMAPFAQRCMCVDKIEITCSQPAYHTGAQ